MNRLSITLSILAAFALSAPLSTFAADKGKAAGAAATEKPAAEGAAKAVPYRGKVAAVDTTAKTFTIKSKASERVFNITDSTKVTKDEGAADIAAITAGEEVRGQAVKNGDKWDAVSVMIGAKAAGDKNAAKAKAKSEDTKQ